MHRLTCNDADRLAADLDRAAATLHQHAAMHSRYATGLHIVADHRWAEYHSRTSESTRAQAHQLEDYAARLRDREPLWQDEDRASQDRSPLPQAITSSRRRSA